MKFCTLRHAITNFTCFWFLLSSTRAESTSSSFACNSPFFSQLLVLPSFCHLHDRQLSSFIVTMPWPHLLRFALCFSAKRNRTKPKPPSHNGDVLLTALISFTKTQPFWGRKGLRLDSEEKCKGMEAGGFGLDF